MKSIHVEKRPFRTILIFSALIFLSAFCLPHMNVNLLPNELGREIVVGFNVRDASPEETENKATAMLENLLSQLKDLKEINSQSSEGYGFVKLSFHRGADMVLKRFEIISLLRRIKSSLPQGVSYPTVSNNQGNYKREDSDPILSYNLFGDDPTYKIRENCEAILKKEIQTIKGVDLVELVGGGALDLKIQFSQEKLSGYNLTISDIVTALRKTSDNYQPGKVIDGKKTSFVKVTTKKFDIELLKNLRIGNNGLRIKDVAEVYIEEEKLNHYFRVNGKNSLKLNIYANSGINRILLAERLKGVISKMRKTIPSGYHFELSHDDTEILKKELEKNYQRVSITLLVLLLFVFVVYKNWRHSLNVLLTLIANFSISIIIIWYFKIDIHLYSLAGISIAFGLMIDHAIIMVDYFNRGFNRKVIGAVFAAAMSTIVSLGLILLLPESEKKNLVDLALIVIICLSCSVVTNYWFTPAIYHALNRRLESKEKASRYSVIKSRFLFLKRYYNWIDFMSNFRGVFVLFLILLFGLPLFLLPDQIEDNNFYNTTFGSDEFQSEVLPKLNTFLGGTLWRFKDRVYDEATSREIGDTKLYIQAKPRFGSTVQELNQIMLNFEKYLTSVVGVKTFFTEVSSGVATLEVRFDNFYSNDDLPNTLKVFFSGKSLDISGVDWKIYGVGSGFSNSSLSNVPSFYIKVRGYNYDQLTKQTLILASALEKFKKLQNISINGSDPSIVSFGREFEFKINNRSAEMLNVPSDYLVSSLHYLSNTEGLTTIISLDNKSYPVIIKENKADLFSKWDLMHVNSRISRTQYSKLNDIGTIDTASSTLSIEKENRQYIKIISMDYLGSKRFGDKYIEKKLKALKKTLPVGYTINDNQRDFSDGDRVDFNHFELILFVMLANFIICSIMFENLKQAALLVIVTPVSFVGLFMIFTISNFPFDQGGNAAFVMLTGLIISINILVLKDFNALTPINSLNPNKLFLKVLISRSRTIFLTVIATILSLIPFVFEGSNEVFWFAFAIGVISGLVFSLLVTFIVLPILFWIRSPFKAVCVK